MNTIMKDILTVKKGIICQSVNCQGVMGSGVALAIRKKWPVVYTHYKAQCDTFDRFKFRLLGHVDVIDVDKNLQVANIFGQLSYGVDGKRYTDYGALNRAFMTLDNSLPVNNNLKFIDQIYFPYFFGCDRGGGDWIIITEMIEYYFPDAIFCKLPEKERCGIHTFVTKDKCGCI
jgi:hypothetical protein